MNAAPRAVAQEYLPCILCKKADYETLRSYPGFNGVDLVVCRVCELMQAQPMPSDAFLDDFYKNEFGSDPLCGFSMSEASEKGFRLRAEMQFDFVERWCNWKNKKGRVLDVGCHAASFLSLYKKRGWDVVGIDPNPRSSYAKEWYGIDVDKRMFGPGLFEEKSFDLILHSHVLEHVRNPIATLTEFRRLLNPGGYAFIEVPNETREKLMGDSIVPHVYFFSPQTLKKMAAAAGLETVTTCVLGVAPGKGLWTPERRRWLRLRLAASHDARGNWSPLTMLPFFGKFFKQDRYFKDYCPEANMLRVLLRKPS